MPLIPFLLLLLSLSLSLSLSLPLSASLAQLCRQCGLVDRKYHHGVAFCTNTASHPMRCLGRDLEGARKIAARTFAELQGLPLGPWARGTVLDNHTSSALVDAQVCYITSWLE